jgi:hypothetical protein
VKDYSYQKKNMLPYKILKIVSRRQILTWSIEEYFLEAGAMY